MPINITENDGQVDYYPNFLSHEQSALLLNHLMDKTDWRQTNFNFTYKGEHKTSLVPRLIAWYGQPYSYSGIINSPRPLTKWLDALRIKIEYETQSNYNSVLLNYYRDGSDSIAYHSDDEPELGTDATIASISIGSERTFCLKHKKSREIIKTVLSNGSLLIMSGETQKNWLHSVPKTKLEVGPRINLTYRIIK